MDRLSAKQDLVGTYISAARSAESSGQFYMPLGKIARFNNKLVDFGQPLKIIEQPDDHWTLATTVSNRSTEIDHPLARKIVIDKSNGFYQRAVEGFKFWPQEPFSVYKKENVCGKTRFDFTHERYNQ